LNSIIAFNSTVFFDYVIFPTFAICYDSLVQTYPGFYYRVLPVSGKATHWPEKENKRIFEIRCLKMGSSIINRIYLNNKLNSLL